MTPFTRAVLLVVQDGTVLRYPLTDRRWNITINGETTHPDVLWELQTFDTGQLRWDKTCIPGILGAQRADLTPSGWRALRKANLDHLAELVAALPEPEWEPPCLGDIPVGDVA